MRRNNIIDTVRGFAIINMILFHFLYSATYIFNINLNFDIYKASLWQKFISMTFIIISGICSDLTNKKNLLKHSIILLSLGELITLITYLFIPEEIIHFGILSLLGASMIIIYLVGDKIKYIKTFMVLSLIIYFISFNLANGYIGILKPIYLQEKLYKYNLYILGLPSKSFYSSDYFPIIPHFFLYLFGNLLSKVFKKYELYRFDIRKNILSIIGEKSLIIYLLHQIVILALLYVYIKIF